MSLTRHVPRLLTGARSPLRYVALFLIVSCGISGLVRSSPSALWLETQGPHDVGGDETALAREGGSWKMPEKQLTGGCVNMLTKDDDCRCDKRIVEELERPRTNT